MAAGAILHPTRINLHRFDRILVVLVAATWLVHGLYNKLLGGSPRHLRIVQSVPGLDGVAGEWVLALVGTVEVALAVWVLAGLAPWACAAVQTVMLLSMNAAELAWARHLLLWPEGLIPINIVFLGCAWVAARGPANGGAERRIPLGGRVCARVRARLQRHPIPIRAHFAECVTLTYAVPPEVLRPLVPPGLDLETAHGYGFVAVALVQTEGLRPAGLPPWLGQNFFLAGYRVFTTLREPGGRRRRGLKILRSDADSARMVLGGNLLTHYNYHRCAATLTADRTGRTEVAVRSKDGNGDLRVVVTDGPAALPPESPFASWAEARRFAGPLPFTFDYEPGTHSVVSIRATRARWTPAPVNADVRRLSFFAAPAFRDCTPVLAAAFRVTDIDYRWERGEVIPC